MAFISEFGCWLPARVVTNEEAGAWVGADAEWVRGVSGIEERRFARVEDTVAAMASQAGLDCLRRAGVEARSLGLVMVASGSGERSFPGPAAETALLLGIPGTPALDVPMASAGSLFALGLAARLAASVGPILVIGAEKMSSIALREPMERGVAVLFGDGAGAAILQSRPGSHGLLTAVMGADGAKSNLIHMPGGGSRCPASVDSVAAKLHYLRMDGRETFKSAVQAMYHAAQEALRRCELDISKIKCIIPHQANRRIIDVVGERLGATPEQLFVNLDKYGNTSAASVAIALDEAVTSGKISRGDLILLVVFGSGLTWGAAVIEW